MRTWLLTTYTTLHTEDNVTETQLLQQLVDQHQLRPADKYKLECVQVVEESGCVNCTGGDDVKSEQLQFNI